MPYLPGYVCLQSLPDQVFDDVHWERQSVLLGYLLLLGAPDHAVTCHTRQVTPQAKSMKHLGPQV